MHFLYAAKESPPVAVGKDWSPSGREILGWCSYENHIIVNLGQKYDENLGY